MKERILGFTLTLKNNAWHAVKCITGKTRWVYIGKDKSKAEEKILAWCAKHEVILDHEAREGIVQRVKDLEAEVTLLRKHVMAANWDIFGDEKKDDGDIKSVGLFCIETGIVSQLTAHLIREKDLVQSKLTEKIGEIHWSALSKEKVEVILKWLDLFFRSPLVFFVYIPCLDKKSSRFDLIKEVIEKLEKDIRVPHGLVREKTTLHLDYDSQDTKHFWELRRGFGLLRAFPWDSHGSPLLQLTDVLLGISEYEYEKKEWAQSKKENFRQKIIGYARNCFQKQPKNFVFAYEQGNQIKQLITVNQERE